MSWRDAFPAQIMSAKKLGKRVVTGIIQSVETMALKDQQGEDQSRLVLYLTNEKTPFGLNVGNCEALSAKWGDDEKKWKGKRVRITTEPRRKPDGEMGRGLVFEPLGK